MSLVKFDNIEDLNDRKNDWNIMVRVERLWTATTTKNKTVLALNMILIDNQGSQIQASIQRIYMVKFKPLIHEGGVHIFKNFTVMNVTGEYRVVTKSICIDFLPSTIVTFLEKNVPDIPRFRMNLIPFEHLTMRIKVNTFLTDFVGIVDEVQPTQIVNTFNGVTKTCKIRMHDINDNAIVLTLWSDKIDEFNRVITTNSDTIQILAVTSTKVGKFKDEMTLSTNTATKIYVNPPIPEVEQLHHMFSGKTALISHCALTESRVQIASKNVSFGDFVLASISADAENVIYIFKADIESIDESVGWMYKACPHDNKKLDARGDIMMCKLCGRKIDVPLLRYKIDAVFKDKDTVLTMTLWNNHVFHLINTEAKDLVETVNEIDGIFPITMLLQSIVGRTYQIHAQLRNLNHYYGRHTIAITKVENIKPDPNIVQLSENKISVKIEGDSSPRIFNSTALIIGNSNHASTTKGIEVSSPTNKILTEAEDEFVPCSQLQYDDDDNDTGSLRKTKKLRFGE